MTRVCLDCPTPVGPNAKRCKPHAMAEVNRRADKRARAAERMKAMHQLPSFRAACEAVRLERNRRISAGHLAWCPPHLRQTNIELRKAGYGRAERQKMIAEIEAREVENVRDRFRRAGFEVGA